MLIYWRYNDRSIIGHNDYVEIKGYFVYVANILSLLPSHWYNKEAIHYYRFVDDKPIKDVVEQWAAAGGYGGLTLVEYIKKVLE